MANLEYLLLNIRTIVYFLMQRPVFIILPITPLLRSPLHSASNNRDEIQATVVKALDRSHTGNAFHDRDSTKF